MNWNAAFLFIAALGLVKAALFAAFICWCLRNDQAEDGGGSGDGGIGKDSPEGYPPRGPISRGKWKVSRRRSQAVQ